VYESDTVLPLEIYLGSSHMAQFSEVDQKEAREMNVNLLEEERNKDLTNVKKYEESLKHHYNKKVVLRALEVGDLMLKKDIRRTNKHKFSSLWEGSYIVVEIATPRAYVLTEIDDKLPKNAWNENQLPMYYV
jgi:hypothetical protein